MDARTWGNECMMSVKSLKSLAVLTAWLIDNDFGFSPIVIVNNMPQHLQVTLLVSDNPIEDPNKVILEKDRLPKCIYKAITNICDELKYNYGNVDYLDV